MQTGFTCGIYTAKYVTPDTWDLIIYPHRIGSIDGDGSSVLINAQMRLPLDDLIEIAVLMNNIKRQYKALQTN